MLALLTLLATAAAPQDLAARLEAAVDLPDPAARRRAAAALAAEDVPLADWLEACRTFGRFGARPPGTSRVDPEGTRRGELWVHVPGGYDPGTRHPALLVLHATGGEGAAALGPWIPVAERLGMVLLAPTERGANEGYAYSEEERAEVLAALRYARRTFALD